VLVSSDAHAVLGTEPVDPVQAMLTGPALVLPLEQPDLTCRVVDISLTQPRAWGDRDVDSLLGELTAPAADPLVALRGGRRWRRGHRPVRLPDTVATPVLRPGGVYLITGGFGGVGLTLARHLATGVGARLVLVGRSPLPPRDEWDTLLAAVPDDDPAAVRVRAVRELEDLGAEVLAVDADVADPARMEEVAALAVARFGAVDGIVHAAGVPAAGPAQLKDDAEILRVLAPKVSGGLAVDRLARLLRPDFTVLCSSTLALTGGLGQVDYAAGNAFLAALAHRNDLLGGPVTVAVDWDGWQRVGMAARIVGRSADTGAAVGPVDHPLVRACLADDADTAVYRVPLSVADSWLVDEHRMAGSAVVPGTGHLELVRAAWQHQTGERTAELRDVTFLAPVVVADDEHRELRVVLDKRQLPYRFTVLVGPGRPASGAAGTPGQDWRVHATGRVGPLTEATPDRWDASELVRRGAMRDLGAVEHRGPMGFGPRSRCLRRVHLGSREALAELELPEEFGTDLDRIHLHPSLLDLAAGFHGMNLAEEFRIPLSYGRLLLHAPLPRRLFSHHRFHEADRRGKETLTSDITLFDEHGRVVARVEGFVLKRVADLTGRIAELRAGTSRDAVVQPLPVLAPAPAPGRGSGQLDGHLAAGILPEEGVTALLRLLAAGIGPQVAVVTKDLDAVRDDIRRTSSAVSRPAGDSGAPAGSRADDDRSEPTPDDLARLWAELLGVRRVAPHDSFFELGGHSLLGLQMIARIRDRFGVEIGLDSLYETPTAAGLSALLCAAADERRTAPSPA
jgi:NAD(P)-dependent dehydrogenase (short-subunit alcohol dehydrogenase family)/acyl carrier protein